MKLLCLLAGAFLVGCPDLCTHPGIVKSIGGCDKYGACGVALEDGTHLRGVYMPSVGMFIPSNRYCEVAE